MHTILHPFKVAVQRNHGIALVVVLWMLVVLSVMAASFTVASRQDSKLVYNLVEQAKARSMITAGLERAMLGLMHSDEDLRWRRDGSQKVFSYDGGKVAVQIIDEKGKVDLNTGPEPLIRGVFLAAGLNDEEASSVTDAIIDWRDEDSARQLNGAEDREYEVAGLAWGAADQPFRSATELRAVLGITPDLYRLTSDAFTVHSRDGTIDPLSAPLIVLRGLPGGSESDIDAILALRQEDPYVPWEAVLAKIPWAEEWIEPANGPIFGVDIVAETANGVRAAAYIVVWLDADEERPYRILDWQEPLPDDREGTEGQ